MFSTLNFNSLIIKVELTTDIIKAEKCKNIQTKNP
jgi:hypothetical protein